MHSLHSCHFTTYLIKKCHSTSYKADILNFKLPKSQDQTSKPNVLFYRSQSYSARLKKTLALGEALLYFTNSVTASSLDFGQPSSRHTWNSRSRLALDKINLIKHISLNLHIRCVTPTRMRLENKSSVHCALRKSLSTSSSSSEQ